MNDDRNETPKDLGGAFGPLFDRLRELQRRFRPGHPFQWPEHPKHTRRPLAARKADRRRKNKAAKIARRHNRRPK